MSILTIAAEGACVKTTLLSDSHSIIRSVALRLLFIEIDRVICVDSSRLDRRATSVPELNFYTPQLAANHAVCVCVCVLPGPDESKVIYVYIVHRYRPDAMLRPIKRAVEAL